MKIKYPNVQAIIGALNTIQETVSNLTPPEERELRKALDALAHAFNADAPEEHGVPGVHNLSIALSGVAGQVRDEYGVGS
jgi:hypothetical protein